MPSILHENVQIWAEGPTLCLHKARRDMIVCQDKRCGITILFNDNMRIIMKNFYDFAYYYETNGSHHIIRQRYDCWILKNKCKTEQISKISSSNFLIPASA